MPALDIICEPGTTVYWLQFFPKNHAKRFSPLIRSGKVDSISIKKNYIAYVIITKSKCEVSLFQKDFGEKWFLSEQAAKKKTDELWEEMVK